MISEELAELKMLAERFVKLGAQVVSMGGDKPDSCKLAEGTLKLFEMCEKNSVNLEWIAHITEIRDFNEKMSRKQDIINKKLEQVLNQK